jgi:hypothetical protein
MFCEYEKGNVFYDQLDPDVLEDYHITSKKQIDSLLEKFSQGFQREKR